MYKTTIKVTGMMCGMCESHMNDAVRNRFNPKKVTSSRKDNETVIISKERIDEEELKKVVADTGYEAGEVTVEEYEKKGLFS